MKVIYGNRASIIAMLESSQREVSRLSAELGELARKHQSTKAKVERLQNDGVTLRALLRSSTELAMHLAAALWPRSGE